MKWNCYPMYRVPIEYIYQNGQRVGIGAIATPNISQLKDDQSENNKLVRP